MILGKRFVFVHVPRTGGTAVTEALGGRTEGMALHLPRVAIDAGGRFSFGFVRNPWDWMVSVYCYNTSGNPGSFGRWLITGEMQLKDDRDWPGLPPMQRRSQLHWLLGCDAICRFERFEDDLAAVAGRLGIAVAAPARINASRRDPDYRQYYTPGLRDHVARYCAPEIAMFGYRFDDGVFGHA